MPHTPLMKNYWINLSFSLHNLSSRGIGLFGFRRLQALPSPKLSINGTLCILYVPLSRMHNANWSRKKLMEMFKKSFLDFSVACDAWRIFSSNRICGTRGVFKVDAQNLAASRSRLCSVFSWCVGDSICWKLFPAGGTMGSNFSWHQASTVKAKVRPFLIHDNVSTRKPKNVLLILIFTCSMYLGHGSFYFSHMLSLRKRRLD